MAGVLMGKGAKAEDKELAEAILAGDMKNAWEQEEGLRVDQRPSAMRDERAKYNHKGRAFWDNFDGIFRKGVDNGT